MASLKLGHDVQARCKHVLPESSQIILSHAFSQSSSAGDFLQEISAPPSGAKQRECSLAAFKSVHFFL
jgi:hypothetical protein